MFAGLRVGVGWIVVVVVVVVNVVVGFQYL